MKKKAEREEGGREKERNTKKKKYFNRIRLFFHSFSTAVHINNKQWQAQAGTQKVFVE